MSPDFIRHLATGAIAAAVPAVLHYAGGVDWTSLGPYAVFAQGGVQILTEIWNQMAAKS
ncbi:MAG TPA: hypothetical protein VKS78_20790 [Roseiarcus sp.]|nr:hypothetical protein [Roseiarcus sp.]